MPRTKAFDREEALSKAMTIFWQRGYHATSMQDLVEGMGINRSSMYDTFGDKYALFIEALSDYRLKFGISDYYLNFKSSAEGLKTFVNDYVQNIIADSENKGCFMLNCTTEFSNEDQEVYKILKTNLDNLGEMLSAIIAKGQQENEMKTEKTPEELSDYLTAGLHGIRMMGMLNNNHKRLMRVAQNHLQNII